MSQSKSTKKHDNDKLNNNSRKENATIKLGQKAKNIKGKLDKISVVEEPDKIFSLKFNINEESIKKSSGIDVRDLSIKYNEKVIIGPYSFSARIGDRISLVGANGTGKSSILRAINGTCDGEIGGNDEAAVGAQLLNHTTERGLG
jgi:ATPase subunit of ABC transporter with duplicated ATPase domains